MPYSTATYTSHVSDVFLCYAMVQVDEVKRLRALGSRSPSIIGRLPDLELETLRDVLLLVLLYLRSSSARVPWSTSG